jgi:hypothetical protein
VGRRRAAGAALGRRDRTAEHRGDELGEDLVGKSLGVGRPDDAAAIREAKRAASRWTDAGFEVDEVKRLKAGWVELVAARKPA